MISSVVVCVTNDNRKKIMQGAKNWSTQLMRRRVDIKSMHLWWHRGPHIYRNMKIKYQFLSFMAFSIPKIHPLTCFDWIFDIQLEIWEHPLSYHRLTYFIYFFHLRTFSSLHFRGFPSYYFFRVLVVVMSATQPSQDAGTRNGTGKNSNNILPRSKVIKKKTQFLNLKNKVRREFVRRICVHGDGGTTTTCLQFQFSTWKPRHTSAIVLVRSTHTLQHLILPPKKSAIVRTVVHGFSMQNKRLLNLLKLGVNRYVPFSHIEMSVHSCRCVISPIITYNNNVIYYSIQRRRGEYSYHVCI